MAIRFCILSVLACVFCVNETSAQFADTCAAAGSIVAGTTPFDSSTANTDGQILNALVCDMGSSGSEQIYFDVWATFTPTETKSFEISTLGLAGFDTRIAIYDQATCPDAPSLVIACNDDVGGFPFEAGVTVPLVSGNTYTIRIGSYDPLTGGGSGSVFIGDSVQSPPPINDDCSGALPLAIGLNPSDTRFATNGSGLALEPSICDLGNFGDEQLYQDIWFTLFPTSPQTFTISSVGLAGFDTRLAVYRQDTCPDNPFNVVACNDDFSPVNAEARVDIAFEVGTTYLVRYGSYDDQTPELDSSLLVEAQATFPPPINDDCANAIALPNIFAATSYDGLGATTDGANAAGFCDFGIFGDDQNYNDIWFSYTPLTGGCTYISTLGQAGTDTRLSVYETSTCPDDPALIIACADDEILFPTQAPFEAGLDVVLITGSTYLIRLGTSDTLVANTAGTLIVASGPQAEASGGGRNPGAPGCDANQDFPEFCRGDGGDQMGCSDCPCSNNAPPGALGGCLNSTLNSTRLLGSGNPSISLPTDDSADLRFALVGAPPTTLCVLSSGDALGPGGSGHPCFGLNSGIPALHFDGLRCAVFNMLRHGGRASDAAGDVGFTNNAWGGEAAPVAGIGVTAGFGAGQTRFFQTIYRENVALGCMRGLNTTQAVEVTFSR